MGFWMIHTSHAIRKAARPCLVFPCCISRTRRSSNTASQEVELLPSLFSVGNNNFPGLIESVYIVNAGWSQRAMWNTVVKRVLPRSALDKVVFLESREDTAAIFDLERLPKCEFLLLLFSSFNFSQRRLTLQCSVATVPLSTLTPCSENTVTSTLTLLLAQVRVRPPVETLGSHLVLHPVRAHALVLAPEEDLVGHRRSRQWTVQRPATTHRCRPSPTYITLHPTRQRRAGLQVARYHDAQVSSTHRRLVLRD
jgi:hypothetical protein